MGKQLRVLVVEDSEDDTLLLIRKLKKGGYEPVFKRVDTPEAMESAFDKENWDAIIADYSMPQFNGLAAFNLMKKRNIDLPFIFVSGSIGEETAVEAMKLGVHDYIMKDNLSRLVPAIEREIREAGVRRKRTEAEEALRKSEKDRTLVLDNMLDMIIYRNRNMETIWASKAYYKRLGFVYEEVVGRVCYKARFGRDTPCEGCMRYETIRTGKSCEEVSRSSLDGKIFFNRYKPVYDDSSEIIGVLEVAQDITQRRKAEDALQESEERYRGLVESSHEIVQSIAPDGKFVFTNKAWRNALGYAEEDLKDLTVFDIIHPDSLEHCKKLFQRVMTGESISQIETKFKTKDGSTIVVEGNAVPRYVGDKIIATQGFFRDITKLIESQAQLIQAEKLRTMGMMAAGVAHELNNPLMGIVNFAQYCLKHTSKADRKYSVLQDLEHETKRCIDIVHNLLTFAYTRREKKEEFQKKSCRVALNRVLKLLNYRSEKEHVTVNYKVADGVPEIWMRISEIQRMFLNLMSNALDALEKSEKKELNIELRSEDKFVKVIIVDTGCGIAPKDMPRIFDPFFTTKPMGRGTGLGLPICERIATEHNADIKCESKPGKGTKFTIRLPCGRKDLEGV